MKPMTDVTQPEALPGALQEIAKLTTVETAIAIARWKGGGGLWIPTEQGLKRDHGLVKAVGRKAALLIIRHFGQGELRIPSARPYLNWLDARQLRRQGHSVPQIARKLKLSENRVHRLVAGVETVAAAVEANQPDHCLVCGKKHRGRAPHGKEDPRQIRLF
jgi:hypothetical protein